jgi:hypothetical protein
MTRREFTVAIAGGSCAAVRNASAQTVPVIDQNPIRRRGVGLRGLDAARAHGGITLFAPMLRKDALIAMLLQFQADRDHQRAVETNLRDEIPRLATDRTLDQRGQQGTERVTEGV